MRETKLILLAVTMLIIFPAFLVCSFAFRVPVTVSLSVLSLFLVSLILILIFHWKKTRLVTRWLLAMAILMVSACFYHLYKYQYTIIGVSFIVIVVNVGLLFIFFCGLLLMSLVKRKPGEMEEYLNQMPVILVDFSHQELYLATQGFKEKLGTGGFGCVFKGTLQDGTIIAVKRLEGMGQGAKEFLAEVETIGRIHHFNLVRLIGYCVEKSSRLLVYEYMSNGSLDKWIFQNTQSSPFDWPTRKKIILGIAKGMSYLHDDCQERIIHFDIKPQNILLDKNFNAKVSDFGLSKLMDRNQSHVLLTNMRGTLGYIAPEWLRSKITVKVDIYSFGVLLLEIVCGRKNLDFSLPESSLHLITLLQTKADENRLIEIVEWLSEDDTKCHREEVEKMIRVGAWCLQYDPERRPSMSAVVKVLEGVIEVDPNISYQFFQPLFPTAEAEPYVGSIPLEASLLSGPR